jgi:MoaA/NifB/PqqE/SkfB family radical SAM enzyme
MEELDYMVFGRQLLKDASIQRIPVSGSIALTYRCNLNCVHCYVDCSRDCAELSTEKWLDIIDQLSDAGCLWFTITGGEPLLRPDFEKIYLHAQGKGLLVSVFTNGTLIDNRLLDLWREWPPHVVEISIYGYSRQTYQEVTGFANARDACFDAVYRLVQAKVPVRLKTMALRQNVDELPQLQQFCDSLGVPFRFDPMVSPELSGSQRPCTARLDIAHLLMLDVKSNKRMKAWEELLDHYVNLPTRQSLFSCSAGKFSCFVQPDGLLCLCVYDVPLYDLKKGSFVEAWQGAVRQRTDLALAKTHPCWGCDDMLFCEVCPPLARMETGSELGYPTFLCSVGKQRAAAIRSSLKTVGRFILGDAP